MVRRDEFKKTLLKTGASIGANATVICGNTVGEYALIGAGSVVTKDVKNYSLVIGNPAKHHKWVSRAGEIMSDELICKSSGEKYALSNGELILCNS